MNLVESPQNRIKELNHETRFAALFCALLFLTCWTNDAAAQNSGRAAAESQFTNGEPNRICGPALQAGEVNVVQSPASIAAVGTKAIVSPGSERVFVP